MWPVRKGGNRTVMTTVTQEIERKYELADGSDLPTLSDLTGVAREEIAEPEQLDAVYYDTADLRLAADHLTLRRRTGGSDQGWHLKLPVGPDERSEVQAPLCDEVPPELLDMVQVRTRGAALVPVARISTVRHRRGLYSRTDELLAEVTDDRVSGEDLTGPPVVTDGQPNEPEPVVTDPSGSTMEFWREVEVELGDGDRDLLDLIERRLDEAGAHRAGSAAKLARVLGEKVPHRAKTPKVKPRSSAADAVLAYLHTQLAALKRHDPLARTETPDAVHQMRVALRRSRSALQIAKDIIDRSATAELVAELRWAGQELGSARDLEVLRERFEHAVAQSPEQDVLGPVQARFTKYFARTETEAAQNVLDTLRGARYFALLDSLETLLADPPLGERAAKPANKELPRAVRRAYRRLAARMAHADEVEPGEQRSLALHEARKAAKRVRYACELAEPVVGKDAKASRRAAKSLTQLLGDHQDATVARPVLREIAVQAHLDGENGFTFGVLYGEQRLVTAAVADELPAVWAELSKPKRRKWFD